MYPYAEYDDAAVEMAKKAANIFARRTLRKGDSGSDVEELQLKLRDIYPNYKLEIDGVFGGATESVVRCFQGDHGLTPDGIVGVKTWSKLDEMPEKPDEESPALSIEERLARLELAVFGQEGGESNV